MKDKMSTIKLSEDTKKRLKKSALTPGESYENIILRLLQDKK